MAFGKGNESKEGIQITRYTGVASVLVKGLNPSKDELESFYGRDIENAPEYTGITEVNGQQVPQIRLDFLVETDPDKYKNDNEQPIGLKSRMTLFLKKAYRKSSAGKLQVIDEYGRTSWATPEEINNKQIPVYKNGKKANISANYRPAYIGEEELVKFLIAYLNIPACQNYVNGEWVMKDASKLADSEARLENIEEYFKGNVKELKDILSYQPNNRVKVLFGVRTAEDGRQYQTIYTRMFLKNNVSDYSKLDKEVQEAKANGSYSTSEFEVTELHEYVVTPTDFSQPFSQPEVSAASTTPWGS